MTAAPERHPFDWYVEQAWTVRALAQMMPLRRDGVFWDPACGLGTIPGELRRLGLQAEGTDLFQRQAFGGFGVHDFLSDQVNIMERFPLLSIITNPPYGYEDGIAEAFVRKALSIVQDHVAVLVPIKWQASEKRYHLFTEFPPSDILIFSDRPSMPPGDKLDMRDKRGNLSAWKRGQQDYCWVVWDRHQPHANSPTRWIKPRTREQKIIDRDYDLRRVGLLPPLAEAA